LDGLRLSFRKIFVISAFVLRAKRRTGTGGKFEDFVMLPRTGASATKNPSIPVSAKVQVGT